MALTGMLERDELGTIPGTGQQVRVELVAQTAGMLAAFEARFRRALLITDSYRPYAEQVAVFKRYNTTDYASSARIGRLVWNGQVWWRRRGYPSAAIPGTSVHGKGAALDLGSGVNFSLTSPEHLWMREHGPRFGWHHPAWAHDPARPHMREPWHFEAVAVPVSNYRTFLAGEGIPVPGDLDTPDPIAPVPQEDDMPASVAVRHPNGSIALAGDDGTFVPLTSVDELEALKATGAVRLHDGPAGTLALPDGLIWNLRAAVGFRKSIQGEQDPGKVAAAVAATLVPAVLDALPESAGLTVEQVTAAAEIAVRNVLRSV
ncbi:hypothetical protein N866_07230 [Actinotalea ferrariae CF5-4]|uniref:D-alanyl-D-alanine carboxypeptidase-like core domain-containing protein n=1 Tax=Actinotalea ferrariae CF5-4 TaxID=948458 RepID=A0A021VU12_9CELL|nr:M15 family metallopeptidase [Actinotalea ferrariae]EYR64684.1 hypothetical protein N866_07230 [Actinotalea ferrariae CF5-4]